MGDQRIRIHRDQLPLSPDLRVALQVESTVVEPGLPGATVELNPVDDQFLVLEIDAVGQKLLAGPPVLPKQKSWLPAMTILWGWGSEPRKSLNS